MVLMSVRLATLSTALALLALAGCSSQSQAHRSPPVPPGFACTLIGCSSGAQVDMTALPLRPGPKSLVRVCVDKTCSSRSPETLPLIGAEVDAPFKGESDVTVTISLIGPDGTLLAQSSIRSRLHRTEPNGFNCPPVCFIVRLKLTAAGQLEES